jgi:hypothetical protein
LLSQYLVNHYLDYNTTLFGTTIPVPSTSELEQTNAVSGTGSLGEQAATCLSEHGYYPTFTLVDYYDVGNGSVFGAFPCLFPTRCDLKDEADFTPSSVPSHPAEYAANLNGVTYSAVTIGNGTTSSSSTSSTGSSGTSSASSLCSRSSVGEVLSAVGGAALLVSAMV